MDFEFQPRTRLIFGNGAIGRLGELAAELGFRRTLIVSDAGLLQAGYVDQASQILAATGIESEVFHDFGANPDSRMIETGRSFAASANVDSIIGLGGGSSMDCAKGINFVLTNGGRIQDYWGASKAAKPMLPMIGIPTTAGTGSEAQSYALISDADTHVKMACGDPKVAFRAAILDPELTASQPAAVRAAAGYDAISHAVETFVSTARNPASDLFAREAWRLLNGAYERVMQAPHDLKALGDMLLGAHYAGIAIEHSMLGAAHACANPLTAHYGITHGVAIAALLPHVARWNEEGRYAGLTSNLASRAELLAAAGGLSSRLSALGVPEGELETLAGEASRQWTGKFNPRPFDQAAALEIYRCAY